MSSTLEMTNMELMSLGIDLRALNREGKEVIISEFGTGGGAAGDLKTPARTASDAAFYPYYGIGGKEGMPGCADFKQSCLKILISCILLLLSILSL